MTLEMSVSRHVARPDTSSQSLSASACMPGTGRERQQGEPWPTLNPHGTHVVVACSR